MPESFTDRLQHAWNAFMGRAPTNSEYNVVSSYYRPDRVRFTRGADKSIVTMVYNRIAVDVAAINVEHVRVDEEGRFKELIKSGLNNALTLDANIDQTGRALMMDIVMSMFDDGCVAVVPTDTSINPNVSGSYDIEKLRTGRIIEWFPEHVRVSVYNEKIGERQEVVLAKKFVAIIENPLYAIMNEPNSTLQRLIRTLARLDLSNENNASGKLDLIIQLPYVIKSSARQAQAESRRKQIEAQLVGSKYGIAYTDATEKITQINRGVENNLWQQVKDLTTMLYNQLGLTEEVFNGNADEKVMINYYSRTIEPILSTITEEMTRKFLTKTARSQGQAIKYFRDPFTLVPVNELAEIADKFTRNEIATSNEIRAEIGWKPSEDPKANELRNKNLNANSEEMAALYENAEEEPPLEENQNEETEEVPEEDEESVIENDDGLNEEYENSLSQIDDLDAELDELEKLLDNEDDELKHYASPYYDPVEAHEYYMEHRELKGRKSTAGLNDEGKAAAKYVKEWLNEEKKGKLAQHKEAVKSSIKSNSQRAKDAIKSSSDETKERIKNRTERAKAEISRRRDAINNLIGQHTGHVSAQIERLQTLLKRMGKSDKAANSKRIASEIERLREANSEKRGQLREALKGNTSSIRESLKSENLSDREAHKSKASSIRESNKNTNKGIREASKEYSKGLKKEYDSKYEEELDRIRNSPEFVKAKSSGGGGSKKSSKSKSKSKKGSTSAREAALKIIREHKSKK